MDIEINKHLFAAYCGLVASGYSLFNRDDAEIRMLASAINDVRFPPKVYWFFSLARTNQIAVNPYYPKGSEISSACFFLEKPLTDFLGFLESCGAKEYKDKAFIDWIYSLPDVLSTIESILDFPSLFTQYKSIVLNRLQGYQVKLRATTKTLEEYGYAGDVEIVFSPNLLQMHGMADYAFVDSKLYIIATDCFETAILHEYLHTILYKFRPQFEGLIQEYGINKFVDIARMIEFGYMTNNTLQSKCHALEDCVIRGIVGVLATTISLSDYCKMNQDMGFLFVPKIIRYAKIQKPTNSNLITFINEAANQTELV